MMATSLNCLLVILLFKLVAFHSVRAEESFIFEGFQGYPMFYEDEIRGKRTTGNVLRSMDTNEARSVDVGRIESYFDSSARKKSETPFTNEQVDKVLEEAFRGDPLTEESMATVRNNVGESLIAKHALDGSIPLSIIENEKNGNPYQRDIVEDELVESPFSDMDTGMAPGRKFRHKVI